MAKYEMMIAILEKLKITEIFFNSKLVKQDSAFFSIDNNIDNVKDAISRGAMLVVSDKIFDIDSINICIVDDVRSALAIAADYLYQKKPNYLVGVTGTSGKSSVVDYVRQIFDLLKYKSAAIGTLGVVSKHLENNIESSNLTTPDVIFMHKTLNSLKKSGIDYVAFEASSHGIEQQRIGEVVLDAAGFVSFSQDHLDYHKNMDDYLQAKLFMFARNLKDHSRVVLYDMLLENQVIREAFFGDAKIVGHDVEIITVGYSGSLKITDIQSDIHEQIINFSYKKKDYLIKTNILGRFQASNLLISALLVEKAGIDFDRIVEVLSYVVNVSGRLERVTNDNHPYQIFIDFAHKPDAVEKTLLELKTLCKNKLYILFGCGGDRDKSKRSIMGKIASSIADVVILSDDNPRTEDPESIRQDVKSGCPDAIEIPDRSKAIAHAVSLLTSGDILVIAGKGHENYQIIGNTKHFFSDLIEVRKYL
jgi:UDP-N-acetylmuramoyl-L-alanyl-D-glutamate--2,6-diaminopimelate ligase